MQGLTGLQSSSWRWWPSQKPVGGGVMIKSSGKEENAFYPPCSSGVMSQNIGMKATGQRVSVAVFITKKICNLLCSVFIK